MTSTPLTIPPKLGAVVRRVPVPPTRDPFINTPLIRVKANARGVEWFWISTWNANSGTIGALVSEVGEHRIYRFPPRHPGFYSAVATDDDTLWLCGWLDRVVRLTLSTGDFQEYPTGAPEGALVFEGMAYDPATGKLFAAAIPWAAEGPSAFSFDTRACRAVKVYERFTPAHYMRHSFPCGDGTYGVMMDCPEPALLRWDPVQETLTDTGIDAVEFLTVADDAGRRYLPNQGWYDPRDNSIGDGPRPTRELTWIARRGDTAYGVTNEDGDGQFGVWDLATGTVTMQQRLPDCHAIGANVTASGKLVTVNVYGIFSRYALDGTLEMTRVLPSDAVGQVDCVRRIDEHRLLGTPFITQRFWEADLRTGAGHDCGRAAPGSGEVLRTWRLNGKVYMAAYAGGELVEYDPAQPARFPENPRTVADPPGGMRPVASTDDGRNLYYACSAEYGHLGSTLCRYDTETGLASYAVNPLPDQQIITLHYLPAMGALLCGTTNAADCHSAPPATDACYYALIDADTFAVRATAAAPVTNSRAIILGPLGDGRWMAWCVLDGEARWFPLDPACLDATPDLHPFPAGQRNLWYAGQPGQALFLIDDRLERWDIPTLTRLDTLITGCDFYNLDVQDGAIYLFRQEEVVVLEGYLG
jgi:hypothetical protein